MPRADIVYLIAAFGIVNLWAFVARILWIVSADRRKALDAGYDTNAAVWHNVNVILWPLSPILRLSLFAMEFADRIGGFILKRRRAKTIPKAIAKPRHDA